MLDYNIKSLDEVGQIHMYEQSQEFAYFCHGRIDNGLFNATSEPTSYLFSHYLHTRRPRLDVES